MLPLPPIGLFELDPSNFPLRFRYRLPKCVDFQIFAVALGRMHFPDPGGGGGGGPTLLRPSIGGGGIAPAGLAFNHGGGGGGDSPLAQGKQFPF